MWLPGVIRHEGNSAGPMNGDGSRKILLHSTEGTTIDSAIAAYTKNNSWPHLTVDCVRRKKIEHLDLLVGARSLQNLPGGADETNRDGTVHVQIELVGFAGSPWTIGSPDDLDWLGRDIVRPIADLTGVPLVCNVPFVAYPASYGQNAPQRLSVAAWDAYSGLLGHQHAPDNAHGDPGAIDIDRILYAAKGEDPMAPIFDTREEFITAVREAVQEEMTTIGDPFRVAFYELAKRAAIDAGAGTAIVDVDALAAALAPLLAATGRVLSEADVAAVATAVNDEQHRRSAG